MSMSDHLAVSWNWSVSRQRGQSPWRPRPSLPASSPRSTIGSHRTP